MSFLTINIFKRKSKQKGFFFIILSLSSLLFTWLFPIVVNCKEKVHSNLKLNSGVIPPLRDQLNITSPHNGDVWYQGEDHNITFVSWYHGPGRHHAMEGYTMDFILLFSGEIYEEWLIEEDWNKLANDTDLYGTQTVYYLWHVPETLPNGTNYQILIRVKNFGEFYYDYLSDIFTIGIVSEELISSFPIGFVVGFFSATSLALVLFLNKKKMLNKYRNS